MWVSQRRQQGMQTWKGFGRIEMASERREVADRSPGYAQQQKYRSRRRGGRLNWPEGTFLQVDGKASDRSRKCQSRKRMTLRIGWIRSNSRVFTPIPTLVAISCRYRKGPGGALDPEPLVRNREYGLSGFRFTTFQCLLEHSLLFDPGESQALVE
jgi:hypothetical protein